MLKHTLPYLLLRMISLVLVLLTSYERAMGLSAGQLVPLKFVLKQMKSMLIIEMYIIGEANIIKLGKWAFHRLAGSSEVDSATTLRVIVVQCLYFFGDVLV